MRSGIDKKRLEKTFRELAAINGPSLSERPVAVYLKEQFSRIGLPVEEDEAAAAIGGDCGNLVVRLPGRDPAAPGLIIAAHLDTILPTDRLRIVEKNGVFYSDGSTILGADNRAGVAVILECARALIEGEGSPVPLELLFTVGEEKGLFGAKALKKNWLKGRLLYALDSDGPVGRIVNGAPFGVKIAVTIKGTAAHAGIDPESGVSAVVIASRAIAAMKLGRIDEVTTANIGTISGGQAQNIVPELVDVVGEVRSLKEERMLAQAAHMEACFNTAAREAGGEAIFYSHADYSGYYFPEDSYPLELFRRALQSLGMEMTTESSCGASDANIINGLGVPALVLSVGYLKPHTREESLPRVELFKAARLVHELIRLAGEV
ncbi:MAG: M20/M25/M40 family metallo-hydrolase [PVC group bacterium]